MSLRRHLLAASLALVLVSPGIPLSAEPFTFQGFLEQSGSPLNGNANLAFKLYDAQSGGSQQGATISANAYPVLDGVFTIDLNFAGVAFADANRWLQVEVNGTPMGPRIEILPAPVAASTRALQGRGVSATAPSSGQVLKWNGSAWAPAADAGGTSYSAGTGLALSGNTFSVAPFYQLPQACSTNQIAKWNGSAWICAADDDHKHFAQVWAASFAGSALTLDNTNTALGSHGLTAHAGGIAVRGVASAAGGHGVRGEANHPNGDGIGVFGYALSLTGVGVKGHSDGTGVFGGSDGTSGRGVAGFATATSGSTYGVWGESSSPTGRGVLGYATAASGINYGVYGRSDSPQGTGVHGWNTAVSGSTAYAVWGEAASNQARAVFGDATAAAGPSFGMYGRAASTTGTGVRGEATAVTGNAVGVVGTTASTSGTGVLGDALASTGANIGVLARTASSSGVGLRAENTSTSGISGSGHALEVVGNVPGGDSLVVQANGTGNAWAIRARSAGSSVLNAELTTAGVTGDTIYASVNSANGRAGRFINLAGGEAARFDGNVNVSGTLSKGGGSFKIDHPLDPANKYLLHSFVESPDMMNVYNGNITTDRNGHATVELPDWFETLNRDFRYQLTVVGTFAQAIVSKKVAQNRFEIRTNVPQVEVSWQVTGIRQDAWAERNRIPVELDKAGAERGKFLHPEAHGQPADKRIGAIAETKE